MTFNNDDDDQKIMYPPGTLLAPMNDIKYYMYALLEGLASLHELGVVHRDIKQGNFLYNAETKKGILIDFGLAELVRSIIMIGKGCINYFQSSDMRRRIAKEKEDNPKRNIYEKIHDLQSKVGANKIGIFIDFEQCES